jgi:hypothetical protein
LLLRYSRSELRCFHQCKTFQRHSLLSPSARQLRIVGPSVGSYSSQFHREVLTRLDL